MAIVHMTPLGQSNRELIVDADPSAGGGLAGDIGDRAIYPGIGVWLKTGAANTAWTPIMVQRIASGAGAPGVTHDTAAGYRINSLYLNTTAQEISVCINPAAGAAVWRTLARHRHGTGEPTNLYGLSNSYSYADAWVHETSRAAWILVDPTDNVSKWLATIADSSYGTATEYCVNGRYRGFYDFATDGGGVGAHLFGPDLPDNAQFLDVRYEVVTNCASPTGPNNATVALGIETDDVAGFVAPVAINAGTNEWLTTGGALKGTTADGTVAAASVKTAATGRQMQLDVAVEGITAGYLIVTGEYVIGG